MAVTDLSTGSWTLEGWRPNAWRPAKLGEAGFGIAPDIAPVPMRVPGSVQQALLDAGILPDWRVGLNSRLC